MSISRRFRLSALLAGGAVVAATVFPAFPAAAEEPPMPDPVVTSPAADPTPTSDPVPDPTQSADPTPSAEPTTDPAPTETPTPEPTATAVPDAAGTVTYSGTAQQTSDDGIAINEDVVLFGVSGLGYLSVDVSALATKPDALNPVLMTVKVPVGLTLSDDAGVRFSQLATASAAKPLVAVSAMKSKQTATQATAQLVNQTPSTGATHHVFAVYVSPVNKQVKSPSQANNTAAQTLVAYADTYWSTQSDGSIHFALDGVVPWYQSTYSCATQAGSASLWTQALAKAKTAGYVPGKNNHLVLLFPDGAASNYSYCGGAIGLGSVGGSVNQGGQVWVMGDGYGSSANLSMAKETIAHELGHNMSLGHADWLGCSSSNPNVGAANAIYGADPGIAGCTVNHYGDITDVMGFGIGDGASGALSSPQAIRAGIWPSSKWTTAPIGLNQTFTLLPVADHSGAAGWHSIVVQDTDGTAYFVELRNFQNEDSTNDDVVPLCDTQACVLNAPNVRILRFEPSGYSGYPGADTYLIGRNTNSIGYTGASIPFTLPGGDSIQVTAVSATQATVKVNRVTAVTPTTSSVDWVNLARTVGYDSSLRVGDTMTLFLGDYWNQESYTFAWYRNGAVISGATGQNYTLVAADLGTKINASVTPAGQPAVFDTDDNNPVPALPGGYGPIAAGIYQPSDPGTVAVSAATTPLAGTVASWPSGTTFAFQWLRGASAATATTAATGVTSSTLTTSDYTPNAADYNQFLRLKVTATPPGYNPVVRYSTPAKNYSLYTQGLPLPTEFKITGTPKIGTQVSVDDTGLAFFDYAGNTVTGTTNSYQWLRNGVPITDTPATTLDASDDTDYTLRSLDYNASITLRVTTSKPGWVSKVTTTPSFKPTQLGTIQTSSPAASIANAFDPLATAGVVLTASYSGVTETELGTPGYQWYRVNLTSGVQTAITGATSSVYKPVAADYPYKIRVIITIKKLNYTSVPLTFTRDFSLRIDPSTPLGYTGTAVVDQTLGINNPDFHAEVTSGVFNTVHINDGSTTTTYEWRRAGVNIAGQTGAGYGVAAIDVAKALSAKVTVAYPGYLTYSAVTPNIVAATATFAPGGTSPELIGPDNVYGLQVDYDTLTDVTPAATSATFQWYRNGVAVAGKTGPTYLLTSADFGKTITVTVTYKRAGYVNYPITAGYGSGAANFSILTATPATMIGAPTVDGAGSTVLEVDLGTYVSGVSGMPMPTGPGNPQYQWLRNGAPIPGAILDHYDPVAADKGKSISVRITLTGVDDFGKPLLPNVQVPPATQPLGTKVLTGGYPPAQPTVLIETPSTFVTVLSAVGISGITEPGKVEAFQWMRNGVAVVGATKSKYTLTSADRGADITVRIITTKAPVGADTWTRVVQVSTPVDLTLYSGGGVDVFPQTTFQVGGELGIGVPVFTDSASGTVTGLTQTFQWYRTLRVKVNGVYKNVTTAIPASQGGTASYYFLKKADLGATIKVRVTTGKNGFIPHVATYTTTPSTTKVLKGTLVNTATAPVVSTLVPATNTLLATPPDVTGQPQFPSSLTQHATFTYQWLRNGAAITGATKSTYTLTSADSGKNISVRVVASLSGYNSVTLPVSTPLNYNIAVITGSEPYASIGDWVPGNSPSVYGENFITKDGPLVGPTITYQWLRNGLPITGATANTYMLQGADVGKLISVRLTVKAPGYLPLVFTTTSQLGTIGHHETDPTVDVVPGSGLGTLTAQFTGLMPANPTPVYTYKWYRGATLISTAAQYKLVPADAGQLISVQVTMARPGFDMVPASNPLPQTTGQVYDIYAGAGKPTIGGTVQVGHQLTANAPDFYEDAGLTTVINGTTLSYIWYRSGAVIAGASADTYTLTAADKGKLITVKVVASKAGRLAATSVASDATSAVAAGVFTGTLVPVITGVQSTHKVTVAVNSTVINTPAPFTKTYVWKRNGSVITGQTSSSYVLTSADTGKDVTAVITIKKDGYTTLVLTSHANAITQGEPAIIQWNAVNSPPSVAAGEILSAVPPFYYKAWGEQVAASGVAKQWYSDGVAIPGQTGFTFDTTGYAGHVITFGVKASATYHKTFSEVTAGVAIT